MRAASIASAEMNLALSPLLIVLGLLLSAQSCSAFASGNSQSAMVDADTRHDKVESNTNRVRFRGRIAYDGTGYDGWQIQPRRRTVQGELESVLSRRFNRPIKTVGAGRTDAGVHARGQAFHFELELGEIETKEDELKLQKSLNSMLRRDTRVWNVGRAPKAVKKVRDDGSAVVHRWHVIYESTKKLYSYRLCVAPALDPKQRFTRCHIHEPIDIQKLKSALKQFEGTHDFRAFAGAIEQNERRIGKEMGTVRTVYSVDLVDEGNGNYRVDFLLKGALYKMIRNMMGTALDVSKGRMDEQALIDLLYRKEDDVRKNNRCKPAQPEGLCLERVFFVDNF